MKVEKSREKKRSPSVDVFVDFFHARRLLAAKRRFLIGIKPLRSILKLEFMYSNRYLNVSLSLDICFRMSFANLDRWCNRRRHFEALTFHFGRFFHETHEQRAERNYCRPKSHRRKSALDWHAKNFRDKLAKPETERISPSKPASYARVSVKRRI